MWRDFGSWLYHLMLPQAFALQTAHPTVNAAVVKEKKYLNDPWGRARNSTKLLWPVIYSRPEKAIAMGHQLRELHRRIRWTDPAGTPMNAIDPEAYGWVHFTGYQAGVLAHEFFGTPPTPEERATMFEEWRQVGTLLGIDEAALPQTEAEYWEEFERMIDERLEHTEALREILQPDFYMAYPKPPHRQDLPDPMWTAFTFVWSRFMYRLTVATLPESFRGKLGVEYTKLDEQLFRTFAWTVRTFYPRTPEKRRYIGLAWRAIKDARENPEAYLWAEAQVA